MRKFIILILGLFLFQTSLFAETRVDGKKVEAFKRITTDDLTMGGDLIFEGSGSGLSFGSCSVYHVNWTQAAVQNTWYNVTNDAIIDGLFNNVTHDGTGKLTVLKAGIYKVDVSSDWECNAVNKHIEIGLEVNGSGSAKTEGIVCNETKFADEEHTTGTIALLDLAVNDTIELCVRTTDAGNPTIKVDCISLNCVQIGGN